MIANLKNGIEIFYKVATSLALLGLYLLKSQFITKEDLAIINTQIQSQFLVTLARIQSNEITIKIMVEQNQVNERQNETLKDHEQRIRTVERRTP